MILTGRQFRDGRILAGMEQADLATAAGVALALVVRVEAADGMAMVRKSDTVAMRSVLEAAGVEFSLENGEDLGVQLRKIAPGGGEAP